MDRRGFLKFLGGAVVGSTVAYSFPSIIVPKNNIKVVDDIATINSITKQELYPKLIEDIFFVDSPLLYGFGFTGFKQSIDNPDIFVGQLVARVNPGAIRGVIRNVKI